MPIRFGNGAEMADELLALVLIGQKRATASLLREIPPGGDLLPREGDHVVVCDGTDRPRAIYRSTEISIKRLDQIDAGFAWDEGEAIARCPTGSTGIRAIHAHGGARGIQFDPGILTVFERFTLIWPPDRAD